MFLEKSKEMRQKSFVADDDGSSCLSVSQGDSFGKSGNAVATSPSAGDEQVLSGISGSVTLFLFTLIIIIIVNF